MRHIEFLLPQESGNDDYTMTTVYAAGEVYSSSIVDTLTSQSYFNPHIVTILQQILNGGADDNDELTRQAMRAHPDLTQSNLW